jgi:single-strand DNA-binding protein
VCYLTVVAWDKQAEVCNQYLHKGSPLFVEGRLQSRSWDGPDGKKRTVLEIRAERVQFLGAPSGKSESVPEEPAAPVDEKTDHSSMGSDDVTWGQDVPENMN